MTGTDYVIAFDTFHAWLDERSKAIRLKLDTAGAHNMALHKQFHRGQLDMIQAMRIQLMAIRTQQSADDVRELLTMKPAITHGKLRDTLFGD